MGLLSDFRNRIRERRIEKGRILILGIWDDVSEKNKKLLGLAGILLTLGFIITKGKLELE